jgi:hypothetical protein
MNGGVIIFTGVESKLKYCLGSPSSSISIFFPAVCDTKLLVLLSNPSLSYSYSILLSLSYSD